jgi:UDP-N-acetylmuramate--alanine ligase
MPGIHNVLNALATIAVADELSVDLVRVQQGLKGFTGVQRRFTVLGEHAGITIVDDYGHHPAEVEATLEAAVRAYDRRLVVAFQPHRYSRTLHCFEELTRAFNRADVLLLSDVYAAGEDPIPGADSQSLADAVRARGHRDVTYVGDLDALMIALRARLEPGDVLITLGAGNITRVGRELLAELTAEPTHDA